MNRMDSQQKEFETRTSSMTKTIEEAIKKAEQRGRIQEKLDIAVALIDILDEEVIAERLNLSIEKIRELKKIK